MNTPYANNQSTRNSSVRVFRQQGKAWHWVLGGVVLAGATFWGWKHLDSGAASDAAASAPGGASAASGGDGKRSGPGGPGGNKPQPVSAQAVRNRDIRVTVGAIGTITANNTAVAHVQVSGVLQSLNFKEGQMVQAGQTLAQIDPRPFEAAVMQAEGNLLRDKATLDNAYIDQQRYRNLVAKEAVPKQQLDTQDALVKQLEGTVRADQGALNTAKLQVTYAKVIAPISGRVGLKQVDLGNVVQPGDANGIVSIAQTRPIALVFSVPSSNLERINARLQAHQALPVEAWDRDGKHKLATGVIASTDNAIDLSTDTIKLKAVFANEDDALFPNQSVSVKLQLDKMTDTLAIPSAALTRGAQGFYVYAVNADGTVSPKVVTPGPVDGDWTAVEGPLKAGDKVVTDGLDRLRDGSKVDVIAAENTKDRQGERKSDRGDHSDHGDRKSDHPDKSPDAHQQASR
ncbi:MAG: efflux RND transporter periplasmic adaptor subunit [Burkholderiaceae bacterium]|nr:efflux RND transporter periplasmic adaptor subunit [Roseateles sp.]MBV8471609.1 efflux RND transporter periplasmic adaptor subunit [Burkholderiaceae bacterium]